jgi:thioredoxin reductase (NADPH)
MSTYDYDLIVIGGGSGGLSVAKKAAEYGVKVALFDYVEPTNHGTKWGLGGTCVNVGCVPKKLYHNAGKINSILHDDSGSYGFVFKDDVLHTWDTLMNNIKSYIRTLNFSYRSGLKSSNVKYINALAKFKNKNEVEYTYKKKTLTLTADKFVIAVGGKPYIPSDVPGALEYAITSDDIFYLKNAPGKTLCVGASYISLECAGFLTELGYDTTVSIRSIPLRGFDRQCSEKIVEQMKESGTKFKKNLIPSKIEKNNDNKLIVTFVDVNTNQVKNTEVYDTVLYATGRYPQTENIGLKEIGVNILENGKINCNKEQTNIDNIYAIGDILNGSLELTPVAIKAGELLADRLYNNSTEYMNYYTIPTTIFTPFEYGCVGLSEENAIKLYGEDNIEVYLQEFTSLEKSLSNMFNIKKENVSCSNLSKIICLKTENDKVIGFHYIGDNAGEITQGFALSLKLGATKKDFDNTIGIHPTNAESFMSMNITKRSGENFVISDSCGGGKCG